MGLLKNIQREIKKYKLKQKINEDISKYKYVHIMYNDKFNKPFVDFLNKYFDSNEHMVLCYRSSTDYVARPFPEGKNVYEFIKLDGLNLRAQNIEKIFFHSLFTKGCVDYLYANKDILEKSYWTIWGGDLYNAKRDEKNDFVRKNFKGYIGKIDERVARQKYDISSDKKFYDAFAIFPITLKMLNSVNRKIKDYVRIQINNSCDYSTLEMLDILSKFRDENIRIVTILSYGKLEYKDEIIHKGKEIFGDKFEYVQNLMSPKDYANHLAQNDILILNQNRQQGIGNTNVSIYLKNKVFIKKDVSTNKYLNENGVKVYNTEDIIKMSYNEFVENNLAESSKENIVKYFDKQYLAQLWNKIFLTDIKLVNLTEFPMEVQLETRIWRNKPNVTKYFQIKEIDETTHKNWLAELNKKEPDSVAFVVQKNNVNIGLSYFRKIDKINKSSEWGIYIHNEDYIGKGIGKLILNESVAYAKRMGINSIFLEVLDSNKRAIKLYESCDFKQIESDKVGVRRYVKIL